MPSAKQIKARKAFVKKYAKKGKRSKSKKVIRKLSDPDTVIGGNFGKLKNTRKRMKNIGR